VRLRARERDDLARLWEFDNDLAVELAGGGDPPMPQAHARLLAEFEREVAKGGRDGMSFVIEVDGQVIGQCALFNADETAHTCELGITIGDKAYWGQGYGRESVRLLLKYAFRHHNYHKVWLRVHVWSDGRYDDLVLMGVLREEWQT